MTVHALLRHLPHFSPTEITLIPKGGEDEAPAPVRAVPFHPAGAPAPAQAPAPPPRRAEPAAVFTREDLDRAVAQARAEARAEAEAALAAAEAAHAEEAEAFDARLAQTLAAARAEWCATETEKLADAIESTFRAMEDRVADALGAILTPFLTQAMRTRALDQMTRHLCDLLAKGGRAPAITVTGPEDLVATLRQRFSHIEGIGFRPGPQADMALTCGETHIETRLAAWADQLEAARKEGGARVWQG